MGNIMTQPCELNHGKLMTQLCELNIGKHDTAIGIKPWEM